VRRPPGDGHADDLAVLGSAEGDLAADRGQAAPVALSDELVGISQVQGNGIHALCNLDGSLSLRSSSLVLDRLVHRLRGAASKPDRVAEFGIEKLDSKKVWWDSYPGQIPPPRRLLFQN
jgi:hypothetical protein